MTTLLEENKAIFCYDLYLKSLFTKNIFLLEKFISDVTDINYSFIKDNIELSTNEIPINRNREKGKRCDFIVTFKNKKNWIINIELNYRYSEGLRERNCAYVSSLFSRIFQKGIGYDNKSRVYQINIDCFKENNNIRKIDICNIKRINNDVLCENLKIYNINVVKFTKIYYNKVRRGDDDIENYYRWGALFLVKNVKEIPDICEGILSESEVRKVMAEYEGLKKEDLLMTEKEAREWGQRYADIVYYDGVNDGIEKGIEREKKDNIIAMHKNNIDISVISKVVGKDKNYIKSIIG